MLNWEWKTTVEVSSIITSRKLRRGEHDHKIVTGVPTSSLVGIHKIDFTSNSNSPLFEESCCARASGMASLHIYKQN